jgi:hypothetical protein
VTTALMGLSVHYYRPDFTEGQARVLIRDMLEDLGEFTASQVNNAIRSYRQDPKSKYFPTSGQLRELASGARREERLACDTKPVRLEFGDSRPLKWWCQSQKMWQRHWREDEIPQEHKAQYFAIKAKRAKAARAAA